MSNVLVTGGAGFIGSHLVKALVARGSAVTVIHNRQEQQFRCELRRTDSNIKFVNTELSAAIKTREVNLNNFDSLFHLAASSSVPQSVACPHEDFVKNLETTVVLLNALRTVKNPPKLIFPSSGAVYGNPEVMPIQEASRTEPLSPYGVSKLACERYISVFSKLYGIPAVSLRLFSVYGPGQKKLVVYDLLYKLYQNPSKLSVLGDGSQSRDFVYIDDVVRAMLLVEQNAGMCGEVYNVASGQSTSISHLVHIICKVVGLSPQIQFTAQTRLGEPEQWDVDISLLCSLGYRPKYTLENGLFCTNKWFALSQK